MLLEFYNKTISKNSLIVLLTHQQKTGANKGTCYAFTSASFLINKLAKDRNVLLANYQTSKGFTLIHYFASFFPVVLIFKIKVAKNMLKICSCLTLYGNAKQLQYDLGEPSVYTPCCRGEPSVYTPCCRGEPSVYISCCRRRAPVIQSIQQIHRVQATM